MAKAGCKLEYFTDPDWITENNLIGPKYIDAIRGRARVLEVLLSNPQNARESTYTMYKKIRLTEWRTSKVVFVGRVDSVEPLWNSNYGQVLKLVARDYMAELFDRFISTDYSGTARKRSVLIAQIISDYVYAGNLTTDIDASGSSETVTMDYSNSQMRVSEAIDKLAREDPWDDTPTGYGYDYWVDDSQVFHYKKRGTRPAGGPSANGLTLEYRGTAGNQTLLVLHDYTFPTAIKETITRVTVRGTDSDGASVSHTEIDADLESSLHTIKELIDETYGVTDLTYCQTRSKALLSVLKGEIVRANIKIIGFPRYKIDSTWYTPRAGELIRVKCSSKSIDADFMILEVKYGEPAGITTLKLLSTDFGWGFSPFELESIFSGIYREQGQVSARMGPIPSTPPTPTPWSADNITPAVDINPDGSSYIYFIVEVPRVDVADDYNLQFRVKNATNWELITVDQTASGNPIAKTPSVKGGETYEFRVRSHTLAGVYSDWSAIVEKAAVADTTSPGACSALAAEGSYGTIFLDWVNPSDADLKHIVICCSDTNDRSAGSDIAITSANYFGHSGLGDLVTKYYWVKAVDLSGNIGPWFPTGDTNGVSGTTLDILDPDTTPPAVPTGLVLTTGVEEDSDGHQQVWLKADWDDNAESDFASYTIRYKSTGGDYSYIVVPGKTSSACKIAPVVGNTLYYVSISAADKSSNYSDYCTEETKTTAKDTTAPDPPTDLAAVAGFMTIYLNWTNSADADLKYIEIRRSDTTDKEHASKKSFEVSGESLADDINAYSAQRYYWARAFDTSGNSSSWSSRVDATTQQVDYTDINDFAVQASKIWTNIPILASDSWTDNSPSAGYVAWNAHKLYYGGVEYSITASNTNLKYIYWLNGASSYTKSDTNPTLDDGDFIVAVNIAGSHDLAWNAIANQVIGTAYIQDAAIVNAKIHDLSADKIDAGILQSTNWGASAGSQFVLSDGTFKLGGSSAPKLSWNGTALNITGVITFTAGSEADYSYITGTKPPADADNTLANPQSYAWITGSKPPTDAEANPDYIHSTYISATEIQSPAISGNTGYFSLAFKVGIDGVVIDGVNKLIKSSNYNEVGEVGWQIDNAGNAHFYGGVVAAGLLTGDIAVARITAQGANAINAGVISIAANRLNISGETTFAPGYDPSDAIQDVVELLDSNASSGQKDVVLEDNAAAARYDVGDEIELKDDSNSETCEIASIASATLTMVNILTYSYTVVANAKVTLFGAADNINNGVTTIDGGLITTNTILANAITTSTLTSRVITLGSGGKFVTGPAGTNRIEITSVEVAGYTSGNTKQFYMDATTGKAYAGGGAVVLDEEGITVIGDCFCRYWSSDPHPIGSICSLFDDFCIHSVEDVEGWDNKTLWLRGGLNTNLDAHEQMWITSYGGNIDITADSVLYLESGNGDLFLHPGGTSPDVIPTSLNFDFGSSSSYWRHIECVDINYHCPMKIPKGALGKLKNIQSKKEGGIEIIDKDTLPVEILNIPAVEDYNKAKRTYQKLLRRWEGKIEGGHPKPGPKPVEYKPQEAVSSLNLFGLVLASVQELTSKVEAIEKILDVR